MAGCEKSLVADGPWKNLVTLVVARLVPLVVASLETQPCDNSSPKPREAALGQKTSLVTT